MPTIYARVNPSMLTWARERAQYSIDTLTRSFRKIAEWESGEAQPTFNQAQRFAKKVHVPFGFLFLENPPASEFPLPDLRTVGGGHVNNPSVELREIVEIMTLRQEWYREYLLEQGHDRLNFVGKFNLQSPPAQIVRDIRARLDLEALPQRGTWEEYYNDLVRRIESIGILVMRQAHLGSWHRTFDVSEFRGFAMVDDLAPLIFVNHADYPSPRMFTLIHELAHVWLGKSGVSDVTPNNQNEIEILCNAVAGEFLVPEQEFLRRWPNDADDWTQNLPQLSAYFHVSKIVIARRALATRRITREQYRQFDQEQKDYWANRERGNGGGSYYRTESARISKNFSYALVSEALSGKVLLRDAGQLLRMKPSNIAKYAKELGI